MIFIKTTNQKRKERVREKQIITYFNAKETNEKNHGQLQDKPINLTPVTLNSSKSYLGNIGECAGRRLVLGGMQVPAHFPPLQQ